MDQKYTIIMPIKKQEGKSNTSIFSTISIFSYLKYLQTNDLDSFIIICPENNLELFNNMITPISGKIPFKFIAEETLLNEFNGKDWHKQQVLKMAVSKIINTKYYLIVDSDQFLVDNLSMKDLLKDEKIKYSYEPYQTINSSEYSTNSNWWMASCKYFGYNTDTLKKDNYLMGVTPQIFVTSIARELSDLINQNYDLIFNQLNCTEYTLYWIYILKTNRSSLYIPDNTLWTHDTTKNGLTLSSLSKLKSAVTLSATSKSSKFCTIQGYFDYSSDWIYELSCTYFNTIRDYTIEDYKTFLDEFKVVETPYPKIRIGNRHDGGYIISNIFEKNPPKALIAYGVGNNINFETQFCFFFDCKQCFLYDHTVNLQTNFTFKKQGIDYYKHDMLDTLKNHMDTIEVKSNDLVLKIDVEGWEYLSLLTTPDEYLKKFTQIIMEVHWLHSDCNGLLEHKLAMMKKLNNLFYLVHVHPNNCADTITTPFPIHQVLELTFVRKDLVPGDIKYTNNFKSPLDFPNDPHRPEIFMTKFYPYISAISTWKLEEFVQLFALKASKERRYCSFSIIETDSMYKNISRVIKSDGDTENVWITHDKETGLQIGEEKSVINGDDARLFTFNFDEYIYTYRFDTRNTIPIIHNITKDRFTILWSESIKDNGKNWSFYEYKNELYMIFSFQPLIICKVNTISGNYTIHHSETNDLSFPFHQHTKIGPLRGGTNGLAINDNYIFGIGHEQGDSYKPFLWVINMTNYKWDYQYPSNMEINGTYTFNPFNLWKNNNNYYISAAISDSFVVTSNYNHQKIIKLCGIEECVSSIIQRL